MNVKIQPPCCVVVEGKTGIYYLRHLSQANGLMVSRGWRGLVAHIQNKNGSSLVPYSKLTKIEERGIVEVHEEESR